MQIVFINSKPTNENLFLFVFFNWATFNQFNYSLYRFHFIIEEVDI